MFYPELLQELLEIAIYELPVVVGYYTVRQSVSTNDILSQEILYRASCYGGNQFNLYPFGKIVNGNYEELHLSLS